MSLHSILAIPLRMRSQLTTISPLWTRKYPLMPGSSSSHLTCTVQIERHIFFIQGTGPFVPRIAPGCDKQLRGDDFMSPKEDFPLTWFLLRHNMEQHLICRSLAHLPSTGNDLTSEESFVLFENNS
jgi:hypothetical protein